MSPRAAPFLLLATLTACGVDLEAPRPAAVARAGDSIVGGTETIGDPAVVALLVTAGGQAEQYCTGTLIAPRTVLTAAHCIYAYGTGYGYAVGFGSTAFGLSRVIVVSEQVRHPRYGGGEFDFGVMRLAEPVVGVTPIGLNDTPLSSADVGRSIRHVGFGITSGGGGGGGIKREGTWSIRQVAARTLESGSSGRQTCSGDSGGPGFMVMPGTAEEVVAGVVSYGDQACVMQGWDGRVDVVAPWIRTTMGAWEAPTCALDGACVQGCPVVDQDCACAGDGQCTTACLTLALDPDCPKDCLANGVCAQAECPVPDVDCVAVGSACMSPISCRQRLCSADPQHPQTYCTQACAGPADCPALMECAAGTCRYPQLPTRALGEACTRGEDYCEGALCTGPAGGITRCVKACLVTSDCGGTGVCEAGANSQRYCRPPAAVWFPISVPALTDGAVTGPVAAGCSTAGGLLPVLGLLLLRRSRRRAR